MARSKNTLLVAAITFGTALVGINTTEAGCHGSRGGYSRGYSSHHHHRPHYNYGYSSPNHSYAQPQPIQVVRPVQPVQQQFVQQQPVAQQQFASQQQQVPVQQQVAPQQLVPQQQQTTPQQAVAPVQQQVAPQQSAAVQPQQSAPVQQQTPANAQTSALQALGGFAPPQTAQVQTSAHVGNWSATLGNGASVRLVLQADGSFSWSATNKSGNASTFQGSYTVVNGLLTLTRANDSQRLAGSMTTSSNNAFSFKLAGNNAAGINFTRS